MPYLKRSFTYKDEDKALKTLRQGDYIENLGKLPSFVQTLLKNGNYLTDEEVLGVKPLKSDEKKPLPVKLSEETTVKTIKLDVKKDEPKKSSENKTLNVNVVSQQGKTHSLNNVTPINKESIKAVKGSGIKVADSPLMKEETSEKVESKKSESKKEETSEKVEKPVEQKKPDIVIPVSKKEEEELEIVSTKETANLVQNKNPKARPQGKRKI